jgi:hypothetical protein
MGARAVLGIDPAWTAAGTSGVALAVDRGDGWRCAGIAPSYGEFLRLGEGAPVDWKGPAGLPSAIEPTSARLVPRLLEACRRLAPGAEVSVAAVDMPLDRRPITGRRACDDEVTGSFGRHGCGVHTPTPDRPGRLSAAPSRRLRRARALGAGARAEVAPLQRLLVYVLCQC